MKGIPEEEGKLDTCPPKSKRARRLDLSDETVVLLREHKRQQAETKLKNRLHYVDHGLIFAQAERTNRNAVLGERLHDGIIAKRLTELCKGAGVKRLTPHGLRSTPAQRFFSPQVFSRTLVQRRLGHSGIQMTLNIYSHVLPSMQADAASRLATMLHG